LEDCLIVDGYNVLSGWPELALLKSQSLEHARDKLVEYLANYKAYTGIHIIVVFDGRYVKGSSGSRSSAGGIEIVFSREGETADLVIERLVSLWPPNQLVAVATSDWIEQQLVLGKGAIRLSARELFQKVNESMHQLRKEHLKEEVPGRLALDGRLPETLQRVLETWRRGK
jgi:predicted RNA-binding protein with PIN domain